MYTIIPPGLGGMIVQYIVSDLVTLYDAETMSYFGRMVIFTFLSKTSAIL